MAQTKIMQFEVRPGSRIQKEDRDGQVYYCKQYLASGPIRTIDVVRRRVAREVGLLERLRESGLFRGSLGLMKIVSSDLDNATLVTEELLGRSLSDFVGNDFHQHRLECLRAIALAGRWLRQFQKLELQEADLESLSADDRSDLAGYCRVRLDSLNKFGCRWLTHQLADRIIETIDDLVQQSQETDIRFVWTHSDYSPGNMIWNSRVLTPIDFGMAHADRPMLDVTYFIHRLEMQRIYRPWQCWPIDNWKRAFLRGYGQPDAEQSPMYRAYRLRHLLCRLSSCTQQIPRDRKQALHNRWVLWRVRAMLTKTVNEYK